MCGHICGLLERILRITNSLNNNVFSVYSINNMLLDTCYNSTL